VEQKGVDSKCFKKVAA